MKSELKIPMHELPPAAYEILRLWVTPEGHTFARCDLHPNKEDEDPLHWGSILGRAVVDLSERIAKSMVPLSPDVPAMDPQIVCKRIMAGIAQALFDRFNGLGDEYEDPEPTDPH